MEFARRFFRFALFRPAGAVRVIFLQGCRTVRNELKKQEKFRIQDEVKDEGLCVRIARIFLRQEFEKINVS